MNKNINDPVKLLKLLFWIIFFLLLVLAFISTRLFLIYSYKKNKISYHQEEYHLCYSGIFGIDFALKNGLYYRWSFIHGTIAITNPTNNDLKFNHKITYGVCGDKESWCKNRSINKEVIVKPNTSIELENKGDFSCNHYRYNYSILDID